MSDIQSTADQSTVAEQLANMPLVQIKTTAPIALENLKRKFTENVEFVIDCKNSKFKNKVLITYLSNLNVKCRLELTDKDEALELLAAYLRMPTIVNLPDLEYIAINLLLAYQGKMNFLSFDPTDFIEANIDILKVWLRRIAQLPVFAMYCRGGEYKEMAMSFPEDTDMTMAGINYVKMIDHPFFAFLLKDLKVEDMTWNSMLFEKYFFEGKNLFHFFTTPNNPLFLGALATETEANQIFEAGLAELAGLQSQLENIQHVPSV